MWGVGIWGLGVWGSGVWGLEVWGLGLGFRVQGFRLNKFCGFGAQGPDFRVSNLNLHKQAFLLLSFCPCVTLMRSHILGGNSILCCGMLLGFTQKPART